MAPLSMNSGHTTTDQSTKKCRLGCDKRNNSLLSSIGHAGENLPQRRLRVARDRHQDAQG